MFVYFGASLPILKHFSHLNFAHFVIICSAETVQLIENDPQNTGKIAEISNNYTNNIGEKRDEIFSTFV